MCFRPGSAWELPEYHCGRHAGGVDLPLPALLTFRRVRLMAQVDFAGIVFRKPQAEEEAIAQLERAVIAAGGLLTNVTGASAIVRHRGHNAAADANGDKG